MMVMDDQDSFFDKIVLASATGPFWNSDFREQQSRLRRESHRSLFVPEGLNPASEARFKFHQHIECGVGELRTPLLGVRIWR